MQKKEFKDFIKEADSENKKIVHDIRQRLFDRFDKVKNNYKLFVDEYCTDDIKEAIGRYCNKSYCFSEFYIKSEDCKYSYIPQLHFFNHNETLKTLDFDLFSDDGFGCGYTRYTESISEAENDFMRDIKWEKYTRCEHILDRWEKALEVANKEIFDVLNTIAEDVTEKINSKQKVLDKENDNNNTEQFVKKYKVTINIEEV